MSLAFRDRIASYFKDRPNVWIDGLELERIGGRYAWRSRVSDCRKELGMTIENRVRHMRGHSADCPLTQAWDEAGSYCVCSKPVRWTLSEYMYVPTPGEASPSQTADLNSFELR